MARSARSARSALPAVLVTALVLATACTPGGNGSQEPSPEGSAAAGTSATPATVTPTPARVDLAMGEPATLRLTGPGGEASRVRLSVTRVVEGDVKDLRKFRLDAATRRSTPYYATVKVTNTGRGDLSGKTLTLWALDSAGTVRPPADVIGSFRRCRHSPLPQKFTKGGSATTCLLYLLPEGTTLQAVQYRFHDRPPYSWSVR